MNFDKIFFLVDAKIKPYIIAPDRVQINSQRSSNIMYDSVLPITLFSEFHSWNWSLRPQCTEDKICSLLSASSDGKVESFDEYIFRFSVPGMQPVNRVPVQT